MQVARHASGVRGAVAALASQIHPVFMLPPVAVSVFGGVLAADFSLLRATVFASAVFCSVYTAHVTDGYVDFYVRGEDETHPLTPSGCALGFALGTLGVLAAAVALATLVGPAAAVFAVPGWLLAVAHATVLDTNPIGATAGYPLGVAIALLGGAYVQSRAVIGVAVAFAGVFLVVLAGVKVVDDAQDYAYDRRIDKRTVAVALGRRRARWVAYGLIAGGLAGVFGFAALAVFPPSAVGAVGVFAAVAGVASRADDEVATMLLIRGSYVFLAALLLAVWLRPFA
ncbi:UbiA family prenyltransferase [Salarchaeum sp. JOR-1]|uniref:UbiA family prenyltransferase n=1 Tax=Salarchaeum sp. JOR-1 TaxID=2599399 RepID=UPI0011985841|nr:UbiA family prenyltransferase [Salarchaeum sp. JOR-1]QDX41472.1 ubiquinone biosynthesis protein UbiA [Salarchaeum sp. JOR-1]